MPNVLHLIFVICVGWLTSIWKPSLYIAIIAFILIFGISSLIEAYLIQGRGKVDAKDVVNFKNIIGLFAVDIIIIAISVAAAFIVGKVLNNLVELFVGLALFEIAIIVMDLNAESYVKSLSKQVEGTSLPEPESKTRKKRNDKKIESES